jgi:hypothetical protein
MDTSELAVALLIEATGAFIGAYLGFRLGLNLNKGIDLKKMPKLKIC